MKRKRLLLFFLITGFFLSVLSQAQVFTGIDQWLVAGSFSDHLTTDQHIISFINESDATPIAGEMAGTNLWKVVSSHAVDFTNIGFAETSNTAAYCFVYVYSKEDQTTSLLLGSDDGAIVWLNGLKIWDKVAQRPMMENEDKIDIQLSKGYNRLLVKVDQGGGGWGLVCNLISSQPLELGITRPAVEELAKAKELVIAGSSIAVQGKKAILNVKVINYGKSDLKDVQCLLFNASNVQIAKNKEKEIKAGNTASISIVFPLKQAIQLLSQGDNLAVVTSGDKKNSILLPKAMAIDLFMAITMDKTYTNEQTQKMVRQFEFAKELYGITTDLTPIAVKGLQYVSEGKNDYIQSIVEQMYQESIKNAPDLSKDTIHIIGHAHMDMNWLWPYSETRKMTHDNIRQDIALLDKFPDFVMLQSQINIYKHIETIDPPLFEKVKKYVSEGRFELAGGMWSEGDCNMSGGEAICRSFLVGQRFCYDHFGKIAHVGWLPDNFGHVSQFPQILKLCGCDYFYFMRCNPYGGTFWWKGPDSTTVLCFSGNGYGNSINAATKNDLDRLSPVKHRILVPTGVGDHGGGPTLKDIAMIHKLDSTPHYPIIKFTTAESFFKASSKEMDGRPTHRGDMEFIFEGCYTSVAEIKENTRRSEQSLYKTEFLSSMRWLMGETYPAATLKDLWETVTFNQFHDILPGSAIYESYKDAVADHREVQKKSNEIFEAAFSHLSDEIAFKTGMGQPVVALNMHPDKRKAIVAAEIFTYDEPVTATLSDWGDYYAYYNIKGKNGQLPTALVRDDQGNTYAAQIIGGKIFPPGYRTKVQFVVNNMPAGGYKTFYVDISKPCVSNNSLIEEKKGKFETDYYTVAFDMKTGDIIELKDKKTGKEYVTAGGRLNKLRIDMEAPNGMNAWDIGEIKESQDISNIEGVQIVEHGPVRACVMVVKKWGHSKFIQKTYIYKSYPRIDFELDAHWFEIGDGINNAPFLRTSFDIALDNPTFYNHVPFDVVKRPVNGQEVPAQQWVDVSDGKTGLALLNKTKFGHSLNKNKLTLSLLRATYSPNIYPNIGVNHIEYSLYPHSGDWTHGVWKEGEDFNVPVYASEPPSLALVKTHATRPAEDSLLIVNPSTIVMSGIKQGEDGKNLIIRLVEIYGKETMATLTLPVNVKSASRVNIIEFPLDAAEKPMVTGKNVSVKIKAHEIVTLSINTNQ